MRCSSLALATLIAAAPLLAHAADPAPVVAAEQAFAALLPSGRLVELVGAEGVAARTTTALAVIALACAMLYRQFKRVGWL